MARVGACPPSRGCAAGGLEGGAFRRLPLLLEGGALQRLPPERILLRMDEVVPYRLVRKVLFTLQQAGFEDVTLVAESRSSL